ncbi:MAG: carbohydrate kinase, partial [Lachnospiraceae bacterium]|nr:carbohydrate kinase [Lachnospiraceae bacterium]
MRKNDVTTLGEVLIDITQSGTDPLGNGIFTAYPGGAPANVAVAAARLGAQAGFIGKVGDDAFG